MHRSLLLTLLLVPLLSGCVQMDPAPRDAPAEASAQEGAIQAHDANPDASCEKVSGGHIVWVQVDGTYVMVHPEERRVAYRESNGIQGLQSEESCPGNPDQKLA